MYITGRSGSFTVALSSGDSPDIQVNSYYRSLYQASKDQEIREYLENKMRQAEWVRQCIAQRQDTMIRVSGEILRCQNEFFIHGPNYL